MNEKPKRARPTLYSEKLVQIALWVRPEQREKLRGMAKVQGKSVSEIMRGLIEKEATA